METSTMLMVLGGLILLIGGPYIYYYLREKKEFEKQKVAAVKTEPNPSIALQLQAYERLVILAERIAIPNLISRMALPGLNKPEMQLLLTNTIRQEFEHNLSQQIYVSPEAWEAIRNLKEQNIHLINQVAIILPDVTGQELNKKVLEVIMSQPQGSMHSLVQEALSYEAKKLM